MGFLGIASPRRLSRVFEILTDTTILQRVLYHLYQILLANSEGDLKGPHPTPLLSRPYQDTEVLRQQYLYHLYRLYWLYHSYGMMAILACYLSRNMVS